MVKLKPKQKVKPIAKADGTIMAKVRVQHVIMPGEPVVSKQKIVTVYYTLGIK